MKKTLVMLMAAGTAGMALAKLPPLSDEAKAKADLVKAKTAWSDKVGAYKLCLAQDRVAAAHRKAKIGDAKSTAAAPACQDPGPYVEAQANAASAAPAQPAGAAAQTEKK